MKRWPPFGTTDGTEWTNGNPATGERGSVIDARAIDHSQAEIVNAITRLGLTPDQADLEQLGKAIQNAIAAATGGGETGDFLTMATARARLPIYPEVTNTTGKVSITEPSSGTILVGATETLRHRGVFDVAFNDFDEINRTFVMLPSKVAHLRWSAASGLERFYLDDVAYNPFGLPETDQSFDSSHDSALLARIVTDAGAAATITPLVNKHRLAVTGYARAENFRNSNGHGAGGSIEYIFDWARTPDIRAISMFNSTNIGSRSDDERMVFAYGDLMGGQLFDYPVSRYDTRFDIRLDYAEQIGMNIVLEA